MTFKHTPGGLPSYDWVALLRNVASEFVGGMFVFGKHRGLDAFSKRAQ